MTIALVLAFLFLLSPIVGYVVVASDLRMQTKIWIGVCGALVLALMPLVLLLTEAR